MNENDCLIDIKINCNSIYFILIFDFKLRGIYMGFDLDDSFFDDDFGGDSSDDFGSDSLDWEENTDNDSEQDSDDVSFDGWSDNTSDSDDTTFNNSDNDRKTILKNSLLFVVLGIVILIITVVLSGIIKNSKNSSKHKNEYSGTAEITSEYDYTTSEINDTTSEYSSTASNSDYNSNSKNGEIGWKKFEKNNEINFNSEPVKLTFTVTKIENYVKVSSSSNDFMVKTVAYGALDGYNGTYEVELPYNKGSLLKPGASLSVEVQVGEYKGSSVIGEIIVI